MMASMRHPHIVDFMGICKVRSTGEQKCFWPWRPHRGAMHHSAIRQSSSLDHPFCPQLAAGAAVYNHR